MLVRANRKVNMGGDKKNTTKTSDTGFKNPNSLSSLINGTYQFTIMGIGTDSELLGYLTLKDGRYEYIPKNKSLYRFGFVIQDKGTYSIQYQPGFSESTVLSDLEGDHSLLEIKFEVFVSESDPSISEFYIGYDETKGVLYFHTLLKDFQLWQIVKNLKISGEN